ncbi:hypothetical protein EVAR_39067_1 [Eumeta japonica]|uniref:Uncharacterized protein n=1 Tax=Eumeta variegata TaxID=151549 RepID=A0A4C1WR04_EUMVA|nr:hypothetical protein EVAR_39067_1 [Eumeta japonica]
MECLYGLSAARAMNATSREFAGDFLLSVRSRRKRYFWRPTATSSEESPLDEYKEDRTYEIDNERPREPPAHAPTLRRRDIHGWFILNGDTLMGRHSWIVPHRHGRGGAAVRARRGADHNRAALGDTSRATRSHRTVTSTRAPPAVGYAIRSTCVPSLTEFSTRPTVAYINSYASLPPPGPPACSVSFRHVRRLPAAESDGERPRAGAVT